MFRYTPSPVEYDLPKPEDDSEEVAEWFTTRTDPAIAQAVAKAEADARAPVPSALGAAPTTAAPAPMQYPPLSEQEPPSSGRHSDQ